MDNQPQSQEVHLKKGPNQVESSSFLDRIRKYKLHYIIVLPAMLFIFIFKIIPFFYVVIMFFKHFYVTQGLFYSPWSGLDNVKDLFSNPSFQSALWNTLIIKLSYMAASGIMALLVSLLVSMIGPRWLRSLFSTLFLIPFFIPSAVFAYIALMLLSPDHSPIFHMHALPWGDTAYFRPLLVATEVIKSCGIPIIIALAAISAKHDKLIRDSHKGNGSRTSFVYSHLTPALKAITAFMLIQFSTLLSSDFELAKQLVNPLVIPVGETLETYYFRSTFQNLELSLAGVLWIFQFIIQLLFSAAAYLLVRSLFFKDLFHPVQESTSLPVRNKGRSLTGIVGSLICSLVILVFIYVLFIYPFTAATSNQGLSDIFSAYTFFIHGSLDIAAVVINMLITLTLAYPLTVKDLPGRSFYKVFLLIIMAMGTTVAIQDYFIFQSLDMVETIFPITFNGFITIVNVFVLKSIFNSKYASLKEQASAGGKGELQTFFTLFLPKLWKPLIAMGVLQFVALWNSYFSTLLYTNNMNHFSPIMKFVYFTSMGLGNGGPDLAVILQYGAIVSIPSLALLFIFRKWLTAEVFIGQSRKL